MGNPYSPEIAPPANRHPGGAVLFFDENGFTRYTNWEVMEKLRIQAASIKEAAE